VDAAALDEMPIFAGLTEEERGELAAHLNEIEVEAGEPVALQGDNAYEFFVIASGTADVHRDGAYVRTLGPGDVFGEIGLLATGTRTASVIATSPMRLGVIYTREFSEIERRTPELARSLRETMAVRPWGSA
jgi:cAMP-dependent protein kinase regulator